MTYLAVNLAVRLTANRMLKAKTTVLTSAIPMYRKTQYKMTKVMYSLKYA